MKLFNGSEWKFSTALSSAQCTLVMKRRKTSMPDSNVAQGERINSVRKILPRVAVSTETSLTVILSCS